jgi:hypothetical protein
MLFDPIFQGLAISLMAGEVASLLLSRMAVPVLFYLSERKSHPGTPDDSNDQCPSDPSSDVLDEDISEPRTSEPDAAA